MGRVRVSQARPHARAIGGGVANLILIRPPGRSTVAQTRPLRDDGRSLETPSMSHTACLSLGSNLDPERHLAAAARALHERFDDVVLSAFYRTRAIGFDGPDFVNAAALIRTDLDVYALDAWLHALEDAHGRDRSGPRYGNRSLDIDIVLFDDLVVDGPGHLRLPRSELRHAFVLRPLAEIAPDRVEPVSGRTLGALWAESPEREVAMAVVAVTSHAPPRPGMTSGA